MTRERARISVEWGYEIHSIALTARNWARVKARNPLRIRGQGYWYEGEHFWDYWDFAGGVKGRLIVSYHQKTEWYADGWYGELKDAEIEIFTGAGPDSPPEIEPVATWFIEHDLSKAGQGFRLRRMLNGGGAPLRIDVDVRAATLDELRKQLPPDLTRGTPEDITNTPVVEVWRKLSAPAAS
jgi:hypothetical protein